MTDYGLCIQVLSICVAALRTVEYKMSFARTIIRVTLMRYLGPELRTCIVTLSARRKLARQPPRNIVGRNWYVHKYR